MNRLSLRKHCQALRLLALCAAGTLLALPASAQSTLPAPTNLHAVADYNKVTLTWDRGEKLDTLSHEGFEGDTFPAANWSVKKTNTYDALYTWFAYPTTEIKENAENYTDWIYAGKKSAAILFDDACPHDDNTSAAQDEWLMVNADDAKYIGFYTYIDPQLKEWGIDPKFPDHYYVKVSHDNGATWEELWDARYDSDGSSGWQYVALYIGNSETSKTLVAFQAVGDTTNAESGLYFSWVIDDVTLYANEQQPTTSAAAAHAVAPLAGRATHRTYMPSGLKATKPLRKAKVAPTECYNVYLDNKLIAKNIKTQAYTETSSKKAGTHTYAVAAVSVSEDLVSDKAEVQVDIKESTTNSPTNVRLSYSVNAKNPAAYDITLSWDAPEGDRKPAYYDTYCNGALFGGYLTDMSVGQSNVAKGVYTYSVVAVYENPDSESAPASDVISVGTRNTVRSLTATCSTDGKYTLAWEAPKASDYATKDYAVYRGNELLGNTSETTFTDALSPEGLYDYSVKVVYADGVTSLPLSVSVKNGTVPTYSLPFSEDFTGGLKPANWTVEKVDGKMKDNYLWRFDNWYDLSISGSNFDSHFASVTSSVAGYTNVFSTLDTPPILQNAKEGEHTFIEFDMDYEQGGRTSTAGLYYSLNGEEWAAIEDVFDGYAPEELTEGATSRPEHRIYEVTNCFPDNDTPVYFAWKYNGKQAYHIAIDNVKIYNTTSPTAIAPTKVGQMIDCRIAEGTVTLSGCPIQRIEVYAPNGMCVADVNAGSATSYSLALPASGTFLLKVSTSDGTKILKLAGKGK